MKEKELEGILESIFDGLYLVDLQRKIHYWNRAAERITGFARDEVMGTSCADDVLVHVTADGCSLCRSGCPLSAVMDDGEPREAEVFLHHKQGHRLPVSVRVSPLRDIEGNITGGIELFSDISHREALALQIEELKRHALVDTLTGLPNRRHLESVLKNSLDQMKRVSVPFGILFADIDHFKKFNDDHGHETGDLALKTVAETLLTSVPCLRHDRTLGRRGIPRDFPEHDPGVARGDRGTDPGPGAGLPGPCRPVGAVRHPFHRRHRRQARGFDAVDPEKGGSFPLPEQARGKKPGHRGRRGTGAGAVNPGRRFTRGTMGKPLHFPGSPLERPAA